MLKKLFALWVGVWGISLIHACFCGDPVPFFDYHALHVQKVESLNAPASTLSLAVSPAEVTFMSGVYLPTLTPGLMATSCPQPGEEGPKHAIGTLNIVADQAFNDTMPAGASLNSLFIQTNSVDMAALDEPDPSREFFSPDAFLIFSTTALPKDTNQIFAFTVRIVKTNGSTAAGRVTGIKVR